ncbi:MAG: hypothetical protein HPY83_07750 [Anaerolineae bacterium]|nr:hypothetical protein [Anaerolineae bacterium]
MALPPRDAVVLRTLASRIAEAATLPEQEQRKSLWYATNALRPRRPIVFCSPEGAWEELLPESTLQCTDPLSRDWERRLRMRLYAWEHFDDDVVLDAAFPLGHVYTDSGWGMQPEKVFSDQPRGAYYWYGPLKQEADLDRLTSPRVEVNWPETERRLALAQELFDGLLQVQLKGRFWWSVALIGEFAQLRGLEQVLLDMCERPAWVHRVMRFLMEGRLHWLEDLEGQGLLALNNGNDYVGSGGFGWTDELPAPDFDGKRVRTRDMWGFAEAQEISGVSPAMHEEFVLEYQLPILDRFGLNCYGCCEPLHHKLDMLRRVPRLRRISISPWCERGLAAEALADRYVYSWKPHPGYLADVVFDPEAVRGYLRETLDITRGCVVEMVLKDTHTCNGQPERFDLWTRIAKEEAERAA